MSTPTPAKPQNAFDTALLKLLEQDFSRQFDDALLGMTLADVSRLFDDALIKHFDVSEQTETPYNYICEVFDGNVFYTALFEPYDNTVFPYIFPFSLE